MGIEYASKEVLEEALINCHYSVTTSLITWEEYVSSGIMYGNSKEKRGYISDRFKLGYANNKQMFKRLNMFNITYQQLLDALNDFESER